MSIKSPSSTPTKPRELPPTTAPAAAKPAAAKPAPAKAKPAATQTKSDSYKKESAEAKKASPKKQGEVKKQDKAKFSQSSTKAKSNGKVNDESKKKSAAPAEGAAKANAATKGEFSEKLAALVDKGKVLGTGAKGQEVADLQKNLTQLGYKLDADGKFGPKTKAAVEQFQADRGITKDGIFGPQSMAQMKQAMAGKPAEGASEAGPAAKPKGESAPAKPKAESAPAKPKGESAPAKPKGESAPAAEANAPGKTAPENTKADGATAASKVAPASMNEAQKYEHYKKVIEAQGGTVNEKAGQRNLLGLRTETNTNANGKQGVYDDKMVMLWKDANGKPHVKEYKANTEPSGRYEGKMGQDANGDGRLDQGRLPVGNYQYGFSSYKGGPALRMIGDAKVDRDTNHDGKFNDGKQTGGGNSMLFHPGGNNMTGSAGCQTMPPAEFNRFWSDLTKDGKSAKLNYTVVNA